MARAKNNPLITDFNHIPAEALVPKEEQPYPLPEHWKWVRLGTTVKNITVKTEWFDAADKYLGLEDLNTGGGILRISDTHDLKSAKTVFQYGDVLYGKLRPYLNKHAVASFSGVCSTDILALRPEKIIDAAYLDFWLSTPFFLNAAITNSKGVNLPRVSFNSIAQYPFPLPPLEEQKQIVAYLDEKLGKIDSVHDKLQDFLDHAAQRKDNLIQAGVTGHLTEKWREEHLSEASQDTELPEGSLISEEEQPYLIPETWKWVRLKYVGNFVSGSGFPKHLQGQTNKTYPFYKVGNLVNTDKCGYIADAPNSIDEQTRETIKAKVIPAESIIFAKVGEAIRLNRRAITVQPSCIDNNMMSFIPLHTCLRYSFAWFKNFDLYPLSLATSTPSVRKSALEQIPFPLPPMGEQEEIARILDEQLERAERTDRLVAEVLERLDTMKQQIVSAALAGRLSLQVS